METGLNRRCVAVTDVVRLWKVATSPPADEALKIWRGAESVHISKFIKRKTAFREIQVILSLISL